MNFRTSFSFLTQFSHLSERFFCHQVLGPNLMSAFFCRLINNITQIISSTNNLREQLVILLSGSKPALQ